MSEKMMQAIRVHDFGGPEVLVLEPVPLPQPAAGQVLLRVIAAGVNPADWKIRAGLYKPARASRCRIRLAWKPPGRSKRLAPA